MLIECISVNSHSYISANHNEKDDKIKKNRLADVALPDDGAPK